MQTFLGLDLAWHDSGKTSALAVLGGGADRVELLQVFEKLLSDDAIIGAIAESASDNAVLAIDAPLVITNVDRQRPCDREIGRRFGHAHASAHSANLTLFPNSRGVRVAQRLRTDGWQHQVDPHVDRQRPGRRIIEVYPHPAHVVLFDRSRIIKYKKGRVAARRGGLNELRRSISDQLGIATPSLLGGSRLQRLLSTQLDGLRGVELKQYEDTLDAVLSAFIAAHYWVWAGERNDMIGTMHDGYIVTPSRTATGAVWGFR